MIGFKIFAPIILILIMSVVSMYVINERNVEKYLREKTKNQQLELMLGAQNERIEKIKIDNENYLKDREVNFHEIESKYNDLLKENQFLNQKTKDAVNQCRCKHLQQLVNDSNILLKEAMKR